MTAETKKDDVILTRPFMSLFYMQVCAHRDVPHEVVQRRANELNESGTSNGWFIILEGDQENTNQWPVPCQDDPERIHYMLVC